MMHESAFAPCSVTSASRRRLKREAAERRGANARAQLGRRAPRRVRSSGHGVGAVREQRRDIQVSRRNRGVSRPTAAAAGSATVEQPFDELRKPACAAITVTLTPRIGVVDVRAAPASGFADLDRQRAGDSIAVSPARKAFMPRQAVRGTISSLPSSSGPARRARGSALTTSGWRSETRISASGRAAAPFAWRLSRQYATTPALPARCRHQRCFTAIRPGWDSRPRFEQPLHTGTAAFVLAFHSGVPQGRWPRSRSRRR